MNQQETKKDVVYREAQLLPEYVRNLFGKDMGVQDGINFFGAIMVVLQENVIMYRDGRIMISLQPLPDTEFGFSVFYGVLEGYMIINCPLHGEEEWNLTPDTGIFDTHQSPADLLRLPFQWEKFKVIPMEDIVEATNEYYGNK